MIRRTSTFNGIEFSTNIPKDDREGAILAKRLLTSDPSRILGLDIETSKSPTLLDHKKSGLCPLQSGIRLIQIFDGLKDVYVFDTWKMPEWKSFLEPVLKTNKFIAHNGLFEIKHFTHAGIRDMDVSCSMIFSQMLDTAERSPYESPLPPGEEDDREDDRDGLSKYKFVSHSLDAVVQRLFGVKVDKQFQNSNWNSPELSTDQLSYASLDAVLTHAVGKQLAVKMREHELGKSYALLKDMQHVIADMELTGTAIDWEKHRKLQVIWEDKAEKCEKKCAPFFGTVNKNSSKQMNEWLVNYSPAKKYLANWPRSRKPKEGERLEDLPYSFNRFNVLDFSDLPAIEALLEFKKYSKLVSTYGDSLVEKKHPITGRIHTSFSLAETRTGRLASSNPNNQNFPSDHAFREIFTVTEGSSLIVGDFSQIELRVAGLVSGDKTINAAYEQGIDLHSLMAAKLANKNIEDVTKEERQKAKAVSFGFAFGMGPSKFQTYARNSYGVNLTPSECNDAYNTFHSTYKQYSKWCDRVRDRVALIGFVRTPVGKKRRLLEKELFTRAPNTIVQGGAGEALFSGMVLLRKKLAGTPAKITLTVHDEVILESPTGFAKEASRILDASMAKGLLKIFPTASTFKLVESHIGTNWANAKG